MHISQGKLDKNKITKTKAKINPIKYNIFNVAICLKK